MRFERPHTVVEKYVDVYGCRNPFCIKRLRTVPRGDSPPFHCRMESTYISTLPENAWKSIVNKNAITMDRLKGVIDANKIRAEREKTSN